MTKNKTTTSLLDSDSVVEGTWNVFRDLDVPDPDSALMKAMLVQNLRMGMKARRLSKQRVCDMTGIKSIADLEKILDGSLKKYSVERIVSFLNAIGYVVEPTFETRLLRDEPKPIRRKAQD